MSTVYVWKIKSMQTMNQPEPDYVVFVQADVEGIDGNYKASSFVNVALDTTQKDTFTPYNELTEEQVVGWVKDVLTPEGVANLEADLRLKIDALINPPVVPQDTPLPWTPSLFTVEV